MDKKQFDSAVSLFESIGNLQLSSGKSVREELCLDDEVSLWDISATYIVLYRFSLLFSQAVNFCEKLKYVVRPFRGLVMQCRDNFYSYIYRNDTACKQWASNNKNILFLGFVPTFYRDVLHPVSVKLSKYKDLNLMVMGQDKRKFKLLAITDVNYQSFLEHWDEDAHRSVKILQKKLKFIKKTLIKEIISSKNINKLLSSFGQFALHREFLWMFMREFKRLIPQIVVAKHILDEHNPSVIISADDADQRCRVYSLLAKKKNIPTLLIQQGITNKDHPEWMFFSHDVVAASGESSRLDMVSQGVSFDSINITGHPGLDRLCNSGPDFRDEILASLGLSGDNKVIVFASQPYYVGAFNSSGVRIEMIKAILNACESEGIHIIVKPHPGENLNKLKRIIGNRKGVTVVDRNVDISRLIKACDLLITFYSTTTLEALCVKKPVINVDFPNSGANNPYLKSGATWVARSEGEISMHINRIIGPDNQEEIAVRREAQEKFLNRMIFIQDGKASDRVASLVLDFVNKDESKL